MRWAACYAKGVGTLNKTVTVEVSSKVHNGNCRGGSELHNEIFKLLVGCSMHRGNNSKGGSQGCMIRWVFV